MMLIVLAILAVPTLPNPPAPVEPAVIEVAPEDLDRCKMLVVGLLRTSPVENIDGGIVVPIRCVAE